MFTLIASPLKMISIALQSHAVNLENNVNVNQLYKYYNLDYAENSYHFKGFHISLENLARTYTIFKSY